MSPNNVTKETEISKPILGAHSFLFKTTSPSEAWKMGICKCGTIFKNTSGSSGEL